MNLTKTQMIIGLIVIIGIVYLISRNNEHFTDYGYGYDYDYKNLPDNVIKDIKCGNTANYDNDCRNCKCDPNSQYPFPLADYDKLINRYITKDCDTLVTSYVNGHKKTVNKKVRCPGNILTTAQSLGTCGCATLKNNYRLIEKKQENGKYIYLFKDITNNKISKATNDNELLQFFVLKPGTYNKIMVDETKLLVPQTPILTSKSPH